MHTAEQVIYFPHLGRTISTGWVSNLENDAASQQLLRKAHSHYAHVMERPNCLCQATALPLCVVERNSRYYLRVMPETGPQHHRRCEFYRDQDSALPGALAYNHEALTRPPGGGPFTIHVDTRLSTRASTSPPTKQRTPSKESPRTSQQRATLLGLLHLLWEESKNHIHFPRKARNWHTVRYFIKQATEGARISKFPLEGMLYVVPATAGGGTAADSDYQRVFGPTQANSSAIAAHRLMLGELSAIAPGVAGRSPTLRIKRWVGAPLYLSKEALQGMETRFAPALSVLASDEADKDRVIILANIKWVAQKNSRGYFTVEQAALMRTTPTYIPVDSGYESTIARLLTEQRRFFEKPLRYDGDQGVLPDFVLKDTPKQDVYLEVWGMMSNPEYAAHTDEKRQRYQAQGKKLWSWEPIDRTGRVNAVPPPFPPAEA